MASCNSFTGDWAESVAYDDPIMGAVSKTCALIAALASVAWVYQQGIKTKTLTIPFWNGVNSSAGTTTITKSFWMNGATFIHTHSSDPGEIWPAIYEKAYAKWKNNGSEICDMSLLDPTKWPGNGVTALVRLTGWNDANNTYATASYGGSGIYTLIKDNYCAPPEAGKTSYQAKYPGNAWTTTGNPGKGIPSNHEYSILGVYTESGVQYIVLRNPKGAYPPSSDLLDPTNTTWRVSKGTYKTGAQQTVPTIQTFPLSNGTFALKMDAFKSYFNAFGFVGK